jgi:hypothetical protein
MDEKLLMDKSRYISVGDKVLPNPSSGSPWHALLHWENRISIFFSTGQRGYYARRVIFAWDVVNIPELKMCIFSYFSQTCSCSSRKIVEFCRAAGMTSHVAPFYPFLNVGVFKAEATARFVPQNLRQSR